MTLKEYHEWLNTKPGQVGKVTKSDLATFLNTSAQNINNWLGGKSNPTDAMKVDIARRTNNRVKPADWFPSKEKDK